MKHKITFDKDRNILCAEAHGDLTATVIAEFTKAVGTAAKEHGVNRLLFDMRDTTENVDTLDAFSLASHPGKRGLGHDFKRAIVHNGKKTKLYRFFETVSDNRGYHVKTFVDIDEAMSWLQERPAAE